MSKKAGEIAGLIIAICLVAAAVAGTIKFIQWLF